MALRRDCSLPFCVIGPVLLAALRRLAETCLSEAMVWFAHHLGSFGNLTASSLGTASGGSVALVVGRLELPSDTAWPGSASKALWRSLAALIFKSCHHANSLPA